MAQDLKYGKVTTERGSFHEDEPVFVLRAQDQNAPLLVAIYYQLCHEAGSPTEHLDKVQQVESEMRDWQWRHESLTKVAD